MATAGPYIGAGGTALGAGASIYGIIQGKKAEEKAAKALQDILGQQTSTASGIMKQTGPLRSMTALNLAAILGGGRTDQLRVFAPEREALESQYTRARENIIAGGTPGGLLNRNLADLDIARAQSVSGLESDVRRRAFEDSLRIGFGAAPSVAFPAFQGASNNLANLSAIGSQQQAAAGAGLGSAAAMASLLALKQGQK